MRVVVVSPHFDDAPLSLGVSLAGGWLASHEVTVGILFSRASHVHWFEGTRRRAPLATAIRRFEEFVTSKRFGYRVRLGKLEEATLRLNTADVDRYLTSDYDPSTDPAANDALTVVRGWAEHADLVLAPLGCGDHIDHQLAAWCTDQLSTPHAYYEDRPYRVYLTDEEVADLATQRSGQLEPITVSEPITKRVISKMFYPSQFSEFFKVAAARAIEEGQRERVWASGPVVELIRSATTP